MPYFTTEELRALPDLEDGSRFPDARLDAAHDWIVSIIERECGTSFIEQEVTETLTGTGTAALFLRSPYVRSVSAVTIDESPLTEPDVAAILIHNGVLYQYGDVAWSYATRGNIEVTYTAGYSTEPPADLKEAALRAARHWLLSMDGWTGIDERATAMTNEYGNLTIAQPGEGRPTGLPSVDSTIMAWAQRVRVPGVA